MTDQDKQEIRQIIREELNARLGNVFFGAVTATPARAYASPGFVQVQIGCNHQWAWNETAGHWTCVQCGETSLAALPAVNLKTGGR